VKAEALSISLLLEMAASGDPERIALVDGGNRLTTGELGELADGGAGVIAASGAEHVVYIGSGGVMAPLLIFASARAGKTYTPINYRLSADGVQELIGRLPDPLVIVDDRYRDMVGDAGKRVLGSEEFLAAARTADPVAAFADPDDVAIVLFTSGTTSKPKAVELSHGNLTSYITGTVEFGSAGTDDAALICVPPYHIAGVNAAMSNLYAGRKMVYLANFEAREWVRLVADEKVTTATVVPTMLDRIVTALEREPVELPTLCNLAYGGSKVGLPLVRRALDLLPKVGLVNAYGLTETSSTIALLGPEEHRAAHRAADPLVRGRLGSVGRPLPTVEIEIRDESGRKLPHGERGEIYVRGEQVSGEYRERSALDAEGWFPTRDAGWIDAEGYLYLTGRADDVIVRGGENISPGEIEDVLRSHPAIADAAAFAVPSPEWGEAVGIAVVARPDHTPPTAAELQQLIKSRLRSSRVPERVAFRDALPYNEMGKLLRRELRKQFSEP